jgi:uncharacterized protein (UPF0261 family)
MGKTIACVATLDTKGSEIEYIAGLLNRRGHNTLVIDTGTLDEPLLTPDITRQEVLKSANIEWEDSVTIGTQAQCAAKMADGLISLVADLHKSGRIDGIISIGGGMGTSISTKAMQALPAGFPKVMVSIKVGQTGAESYIGTKDITMIPSICDVQGLNILSRKILANAAGAIAGMVEVADMVEQAPERPIVVMSENGLTTKCGVKVRAALEKRGYEVVVFAGAGIGGRCQEEFIKENPVMGVIELSIYEVMNELLGAASTSGPHRLEEAGAKGVIQLITPGAADFVVWLGMDSIPSHYKDRNFITHNPKAILMQVNADEFKTAAKVIADKLNQAKGPVHILVPLRGFSAADKEGEPFYDPEADRVFIDSLKIHLKSAIQVREVDAHMNDTEFVEEVVQEFLHMVENFKQPI